MTINSAIELDAATLSEDENNGQGQGRPDHAGEQGPPDHAGEQGPPDHAPAHGRRRRDEEGETEYAWVGVSPEAIEGETNPSLSLVAGEEYTVEWTNTTGTNHNFVIVDDDGEEILASDGTSDEGESETVEFTATEEMAAYYSDSHPDQMRGEIDVEEAPEGPDEVLWHRDLEAHGWEPNPDAATDWDNYGVTELAQVDNLMAIDVAPDGRIWYVTRGASFVTQGDGVAEIGYVDPNTGDHEVALELDVIVGSEPIDGNARELGGQGIALDPDFQENGYVYVYYHPAIDDLEYVDNPYQEDIMTALQQVSRFEYADGELDPDSEETVIQIPFQLDTCCHYGGYLEFGPEGDLYISTGDDSNNVGAPHRPEIDYFMGDERDGIVADRPAAVSDAQRTSANTADLRGSILRITPEADGGYSIPDGNLKAVYEEEFDVEVADEEFYPEIYAMGFRNPYVIHADEHTGFLWVSDYANDAPSWEEDLGPMGIATHHLFGEPIFGGWPYFKAYYPNRYRDFELEEPGQPFWIDNVRNRSPNNTGVEQLPDFTPAILWHSRDLDEYTNAAAWADMPIPGELTWPDLPQSGSTNAGVAYRYSDGFDDGALDPYFEGKQFFMTPFAAGGWIGYAGFGEDGSVEVNEFLPNHDFNVPTDMEVLPDGRVVIMDYGPGFDGEDGSIVLVEYDEEGLDNGDDEEEDENGEVIAPGTTIDLNGLASGWIGIAPEEIEDEENPTLILEEGEEYELGWSDGDGGFHNIAIRDEDGDVVDDLATDVTDEPGEDQFLTFEASPEMAEYVCEPHPSAMIGDIEIV